MCSHRRLYEGKSLDIAWWQLSGVRAKQGWLLASPWTVLAMDNCIDRCLDGNKSKQKIFDLSTHIWLTLWRRLRLFLCWNHGRLPLLGQLREVPLRRVVTNIFCARKLFLRVKVGALVSILLRSRLQSLSKRMGVPAFAVFWPVAWPSALPSEGRHRWDYVSFYVSWCLGIFVPVLPGPTRAYRDACVFRIFAEASVCLEFACLQWWRLVRCEIRVPARRSLCLCWSKLTAND